MELFIYAESIGKVVDFFGVLIIVGGVIGSSVLFFSTFFDEKDKDAGYKRYRKNLGRSILLGLELLIAGDIIRSVIGVPNLENVIVLGLIVLIRSFLGITFEMEIDGKWPWQKGKS